MNVFQKIKVCFKKLWYKLSPTARNLAYLKEQLAAINILLTDSDVVHKSDIPTLIEQSGIVLKTDVLEILKQYQFVQKSDLLGLARQTDLLQHSDIADIIQQSDILRGSNMPELVQQWEDLLGSGMPELFQRYGVVQKSDIPDMVRQCVDLPQITKEYIWAHQMDSAAAEPNTELYNSYKWLETQRLPEFILNRFAHGGMGWELKKLADQYQNKHIYVLTDIPDYDYPYQVIALDQVLNHASEGDALFILLYRFDWNAIETVHFFEEHGLKYQAPPQIVPMARYFHTNRIAYETLMDEQSNDSRIHYCPIDFENIFQGLEATRDLPGDYVEIGTYQGASARAALNYMRRSGIRRVAYFLDTYEGFTYEDAQKSSDSAWYGTHTETSLEMVKEYLSEYDNARPTKLNIITEDLPSEIAQIALCNIDVDIYDAVYAALKKVAPLITEHGIIIAEDYGHTPWLIGAQYAVKKFLSETLGFMPFYFASGQIMLIKIS